MYAWSNAAEIVPALHTLVQPNALLYILPVENKWLKYEQLSVLLTSYLLIPPQHPFNFVTSVI